MDHLTSNGTLYSYQWEEHVLYVGIRLLRFCLIKQQIIKQQISCTLSKESTVSHPMKNHLGKSQSRVLTGGKQIVERNSQPSTQTRIGEPRIEILNVECKFFSLKCKFFQARMENLDATLAL